MVRYTSTKVYLHQCSGGGLFLVTSLIGVCVSSTTTFMVIWFSSHVKNLFVNQISDHLLGCAASSPWREPPKNYQSCVEQAK